MKIINLSQGKQTLVDDADFDYLVQWKWHAIHYKDTGLWYVSRVLKHKVTAMHRLIMNCPTGMQVDHIDGDGLNNQRYNLRICTKDENNINKRVRKDNTSGYKGVTWNKKSKKWIAQIKSKKIHYLLGSFDNPEEAYKAYCKSAKELHGEFSRLITDKKL